MKANKISSVVIACSLLLQTVACSSPEEAAQNHLQKGKELFENGEFDKALLELKTSSQTSDKFGEAYYYMALLDEKNNNFKSMRQNLIRALELEPGLVSAKLKLGKIDILFGDLEKALEQAESVLASESSNVDAELIKASVYIKQAKKDQAAEIVKKVLKYSPDNVDALSIQAALLFEKNEVDQALGLVNKALEKDPKNIPIRLFKVKIDAGLNNIDSVIKGYQELIQLYPDASNFKLSLASIYSMTDKLSDAEVLLREMVEKSKDKVEPKIVLLEFLNARAKDRVVSEYESMLSANQQQAKLLLELSKWMVVSGYAEVAKKGLQQAVDLERNSETGLASQVILAEIALTNKQYDVVESSLKDILGANSEFMQANLLKCRLLLAQNKTDEAIEFLNKLIWNKSNADDVYSLLGQAYLLKQDRKQAEKNFKQALEANPANLVAFSQIYGTYLQSGQKDVARQYLEKALAKNQNDVSLLASKAELDILEKKWDGAQDAIQRLALFSKEKSMPIYLQANILQGKGKYVEAIGVYEKLIQQFPNHLNSLINLVRSYEALKQRDKATAYLEKHNANHPDELNSVGVLSDLYMANNDFVKTKKLLMDQIKRTPKVGSLYLALAKVEAMTSKNIASAKNVYLQGLEVNQADPQLSMALAGLYEQLNEKQNAIKVYKDLLNKNPGVSLATNNLASLLIESSDLDEVKEGMELAEVFKDSENPYFQDTYAWALIKTGNNPEGLILLQALILKEPKLPEFRYHLGVAHINAGNRATGISELKQSVSLSENQKRNFSGKEEVKKMLKEIETSAGN
ncbi:tetratricopeptide repeat protein [Methylomonas albis]|uniref:Tetratricopeptide repeat protein n=1 Tax=Methylomonas albis TaxID=1854563 RepID=A0ABR9D3U8_9GAMM|nr:tetratricopeptide repeat protein [Methylomonas albis]MBD9357781.1 tetratricopeptide repeat protein [Methylomonas albis]